MNGTVRMDIVPGYVGVEDAAIEPKNARAGRASIGENGEVVGLA